ncbi:hypothetical protein FRACYDRAFT_254175 [Fragilariopsis cylindrus CCMP1102]|uniref:O-fucosyltransferase family protein n=1 Tax=Fragilariopsis cylindrus CCMP1102 TaxID=635003 RepID=A0A1E7EL67_9STRA|nr:hypothetical protein FRACYDRAFT_254175 [Fragilariopsis cylindrus CCMP1102]|eukprot:OEU06624.1 hypothetical protein FRACYDRAFT_254175 [Fragilariopsis cylindrus CCMP1102]
MQLKKASGNNININTTSDSRKKRRQKSLSSSSSSWKTNNTILRVFMLLICIISLIYTLSTSGRYSQLLVNLEGGGSSSLSSILLLPQPLPLLFENKDLIKSDSKSNTTTDTIQLGENTTTTTTETTTTTTIMKATGTAGTATTETIPSSLAASAITTTTAIDANATASSNTSKKKKTKTKTLALLYPTGLFGGYRNQAMRFIGFMKLAIIDNDTIDQLLLPTLVWSTRYKHKSTTKTNIINSSSRNNNATTTTGNNQTQTQSNNQINPIVTFWPVPFNELFDVQHWNTFHRPSDADNNPNIISLPLLVSSIDDDDDDDDDSENNNNSSNGNQQKQNQICWNSKKNPSYNITNYNTSLLPLLTYRMLFGTNHNNNDNNNESKSKLTTKTKIKNRNTTTKRITSYFLEPLKEKVIDFLMGESSKRFHRIDYSNLIENCTIPYVSKSSGIKLWNQYLGMEKRSPSIVPTKITYTNNQVEEAAAAEQQQQQRRRLRRQQRTSKDDAAAQRSTLLVKTVDEALIPAKQWRLLAKQCVDHHLTTLNHNSNPNNDPNKKQSQQPPPPNNNNDDGFGYIALHARIEPEMLAHKCGKDMERNLTTILNLVENLSIDYNSIILNSNNGNGDGTNNATTEESPISEKLRNNIKNNNNNNHRLLEGVFVAVGRDEMQGYDKYSTQDHGRIKDIALYNWNVLNDRTVSYDNQGNELFTSSIEKQKQRWMYQQNHEDHIHDNNAEDDESSHHHLIAQHNNESSSGPIAANTTASTQQHSLPIFECGEGWVEYGFYKDEQRQRELLQLHDTNNEDNENESTTITDSNGELLPNNYYGDILPSIINFWLAVNSDIFVGVMKSSWSNDIWTTRYYQGKGIYNFQYTHEGVIIPVENNGLPPPHKNC